MIELIYGTTNKAKVDHMSKIVKGLDIDIKGLNEELLIVPSIEEEGLTTLENAKIKALAYYKLLNKPVFSCDSGLYIEGLVEEEQPGVFVRRVKGKELNDDEMIEYYSSLAHSKGGELVARYINAICLVMGEDEIYEYYGDDLGSDKFIISSVPHTKRVRGLPLDTISKDINTDKHYFDGGKEEVNIADDNLTKGFRNFFKRVIL